MFHIAQALGIPIITYFGSFPIERRWAAPSKVVNLITTKCDQMPCLEYNCPLTPESGNVISPCIDIPIETLLHEVYELLPVTVA